MKERRNTGWSGATTLCTESYSTVALGFGHMATRAARKEERTKPKFKPGISTSAFS